jgi:hypothetical protein
MNREGDMWFDFRDGRGGGILDCSHRGAPLELAWKEATGLRKPDPAQCFCTGSAAGPLPPLRPAHRGVLHISLTAKAVYCERGCPACGAPDV